jgi:hypothetical protein
LYFDVSVYNIKKGVTKLNAMYQINHWYIVPSYCAALSASLGGGLKIGEKRTSLAQKKRPRPADGYNVVISSQYILRSTQQAEEGKLSPHRPL